MVGPLGSKLLASPGSGLEPPPIPSCGSTGVDDVLGSSIDSPCPPTSSDIRFLADSDIVSKVCFDIVSMASPACLSICEEPFAVPTVAPIPDTVGAANGAFEKSLSLTLLLLLPIVCFSPEFPAPTSNASSRSASLALSELGVSAGSRESDVLVRVRLRILGVDEREGERGKGPGSEWAAERRFLLRVSEGVRIFFLAPPTLALPRTPLPLSSSTNGTPKNLANALANLSRSNIVGASISKLSFPRTEVIILNNRLDGEELRTVRSVVLPFLTHVNLSRLSMTAFFFPHVNARKLLSNLSASFCSNNPSSLSPFNPPLAPPALPSPTVAEGFPPEEIKRRIPMLEVVLRIRSMKREPVLDLEETEMESEFSLGRAWASK
mmetsp:Transcript_31992/g.57843  ORF Transcript_31992/g.57843 Transcript_31992/m.57843 type:complete len:379 (+) Transcript_31992:2382-3518(+)